MKFDSLRLLREHAAIFQTFLPSDRTDYGSAFRYQDATVAALRLLTTYNSEANRYAFISLGGIVNREPINKQDGSSPLVERWTWANGITPSQHDFIGNPLAPMAWLEHFPGIRWRLEQLDSSYGVKVYRTIHCHPLPAVALTLASIAYAQTLLKTLQDARITDDLTKIETTQGIAP